MMRQLAMVFFHFQIVPFLAFGLYVFHVMQMVRTLSDLVEQDVPTDTLCGECLKQHGLSVIVSTLAVSGAFFAGLFIAIPALRTFAIQVLPKHKTKHNFDSFFNSDEKTTNFPMFRWVFWAFCPVRPCYSFSQPSFRWTNDVVPRDDWTSSAVMAGKSKKISWNYFFFFSFRIHFLPVF